MRLAHNTGGIVPRIVPRILATRQRRVRRNQAAFAKVLEAMTPKGALRQEIVAARIRAGLSQAELARRMRTQQPAIARLESGQSSPNFTTLCKLAEATEARLTVKLESRSVGG